MTGLLFIKIRFTCLFTVCVGERYLCHTAYVDVRDDLGMSILSFHHVGSRDQTQAFKLGGKHPYLLSHLTSPKYL